jgi:hypothetical protein
MKGFSFTAAIRRMSPITAARAAASRKMLWGSIIGGLSTSLRTEGDGGSSREQETAREAQEAEDFQATQSISTLQSITMLETTQERAGGCSPKKRLKTALKA